MAIRAIPHARSARDGGGGSAEVLRRTPPPDARRSADPKGGSTPHARYPRPDDRRIRRGSGPPRGGPRVRPSRPRRRRGGPGGGPGEGHGDRPAPVEPRRVRGPGRRRREPPDSSRRGEGPRRAPDHLLFCGPPGLGKTSLARIVAEELGSELHSTSGPALDKPKDLLGLLTSLKRGDVFFIDEIHRIPIGVEEYLYTAMEDFRVEMTLDSGPHARVLPIFVEPFTLVGATTREGLLTGPFRSRFGLVQRLSPTRRPTSSASSTARRVFSASGSIPRARDFSRSGAAAPRASRVASSSAPATGRRWRREPHRRDPRQQSARADGRRRARPRGDGSTHPPLPRRPRAARGGAQDPRGGRRRDRGHDRGRLRASPPALRLRAEDPARPRRDRDGARGHRTGRWRARGRSRDGPLFDA